MEESQDGLEEKGTAVILLETLSTKEATLFQIRRFPSTPTFAFLYSCTYLLITQVSSLFESCLHYCMYLETYRLGPKVLDILISPSSEHNVGVYAFFS